MNRLMKGFLFAVLCLVFLSACGDSNNVKTAKYFDKAGQYEEALQAWIKVLRTENDNNFAHERFVSLALRLNKTRMINNFYRSSLERKAYLGQHREKIQGIFKQFFLDNFSKERIIKDSFVFVLEELPGFRGEGIKMMIKEARRRAEEMPLTRVNSSYIDDALNLCRYFKYDADQKFAEIYFICGQRDDCKDSALYFHKAVALDSQYKPYLAREMFKKASNTRNIEERLYLLNEVVLLTDKSLPYSQALLNEFKKLKKEKSLKKMRALVKKYGKSLSPKDREFLAPAPTWQEVPGSRFEVVGKGFGSGDKGDLVINIKKLKKGDKYVIISRHFQMKDRVNGYIQWVSYYKKIEVPCTRVPNGYPYAFRAEKGEKAIVFVMRKM